MEIQRQSDYYGLDRPEPRQAHLTADQISALIAGPQITPGLLNTRTAWQQGDPWTYAPENHVPEDDDAHEPNAEELDLEDDLERHDNEIPEDLVEQPAQCDYCGETGHVEDDHRPGGSMGLSDDEIALLDSLGYGPCPDCGQDAGEHGVGTNAQGQARLYCPEEIAAVHHGYRIAAPMTDPGGGASADTMAIAAGPGGATPNAGIAMPTVGTGLNALTSEINLDPSNRGSYDGADFNPGPMYFPPD
jgi:hypothetical protein